MDSKKTIQQHSNFSSPGRKKIKLNDKETLEKIIVLGSQGLTTGQIAKCLGVSWSTLDRRKKEFEEIDDAIKKGEALGVSRVANALYESAVNDKNVTAQIFYLKNRSDNWSDRQEVNHNLNLSEILTDARARVIEVSEENRELSHLKKIKNISPDEKTFEDPQRTDARADD